MTRTYISDTKIYTHTSKNPTGYIMWRKTRYKIDNFANLSCFLNSTEDGLPEKNRNINEREKMHKKQSRALLRGLLPFFDDRKCRRAGSRIDKPTIMHANRIHHYVNQI
jgi:hypothetical protein